MDLRTLRYFVTLAETRHFGRAAERLNLTQPPLSRAIAALERELAVALFERHPREVRLTAAGEQLLLDARALLDAAKAAARNARLAAKGESGEIVLGFMMHAAHTVVPNLVSRFSALYPHIRLVLRETLPNQLPDDLIAGRIDAGILFPFAPREGLETRLIFTDRLCVAIPTGHKLAGQALIRREHLRGEGLIATLFDTTPALRVAIAQYCAEGGFQPHIITEVQLQQTLVSLVAEGLGLGLVPASMQKAPMPGVTYRPLDDAPEIGHVLAWSAANPNRALPRLLDMAQGDTMGGT